MTNRNFESISALIDDETNPEELEQALERWQSDDCERFSRYSLIGDVMRNEQHILTDESFAERISAAVADIDLTAETSEADKLVPIASHPKWHQRIANKLSNFGQSSTGKGMSQLAIAASVTLVAVVGVSNMTPERDEHMPAPVISTVPLVDGISPVSTDGLKSKPNANQVTQSRINALIADHNQQLRAADGEKKEEEDKEDIDQE